MSTILKRTGVAAFLCCAVTLSVGVPAWAAPAEAPLVRSTEPVEEPDAETVPVDENFPVGETPDWVDEEATSSGPGGVGESEYVDQIVGGATGGDAAEYDAKQPMDPATVGKVFNAAATEGQVQAFGPVSKKISVVHYGQKTGFYCGPASGYMMLRYLNAGKSKRTNQNLSQKALANGDHMNTDANHGTPWTSKRFITGVNRWRGNKFYVQVNKPSHKVVRGAFTWTIGSGSMPVAADTVELAGGAHYNNHPRNRTIGHWIVGYGYEANGSTLLLADPANTVYPNAKKHFKMSSANLTKFLQYNGLVY